MAPEHQFFTLKFGCCGMVLKLLVSEESSPYFTSFKYLVLWYTLIALHIHNRYNDMVRTHIYYIKAHPVFSTWSLIYQILMEILTLSYVYFQTLQGLLLTFYSIVSSRAKLASSQEHTLGIVSELLPHECCPSVPIRLTFYWDVTDQPCSQSLWNWTHLKHCLMWQQQQESKSTKPTLQSTPEYSK